MFHKLEKPTIKERKIMEKLSKDKKHQLINNIENELFPSDLRDVIRSIISDRESDYQDPFRNIGIRRKNGNIFFCLRGGMAKKGSDVLRLWGFSWRYRQRQWEFMV